MNVSEETRAQIIKEHRREVARKAAATLKKRRGVSYFKRLGAKGGSAQRQNAA